MSLLLTLQAKNRIKEVLENTDKYFKISILSGGCSGMMYDFSLISTKEAEDLEVYDHVLIDNDTKDLLEDSVLDYVSETFSSRFLVINPNETARCGCSKSFSV